MTDLCGSSVPPAACRGVLLGATGLLVGGGLLQLQLFSFGHLHSKILHHVVAKAVLVVFLPLAEGDGTAWQGDRHAGGALVLGRRGRRGGSCRSLIER
jgi:hypothetical protein